MFASCTTASCTRVECHTRDVIILRPRIRGSFRTHFLSSSSWKFHRGDLEPLTANRAGFKKVHQRPRRRRTQPTRIRAESFRRRHLISGRRHHWRDKKKKESCRGARKGESNKASRHIWYPLALSHSSRGLFLHLGGNERAPPSGYISTLIGHHWGKRQT